MKKFALLIVIALVLAAGAFFIFIYRMGTSDAKALADFPAAYQAYDHALTDYSRAVLTSTPGNPSEGNSLETKAHEALATLNTKASVRISSLTRHDGDLMQVSLEIAHLAEKEMDTLKAYQAASAGNASGLELLAKQLQDLTHQRQAAYASYEALAGNSK